MSKKCKHKWVDIEDGSLDQFCVRCRKFQMQNIMELASVDASSSLSVPLGRETIEVPFYNGSEHTRMTVYKDDLIKQMNEEIGLTINHFSKSARR